MEKEAGGDTSGGDRAAEDSVSGVTEAGTSGNAAEGEKARRHGDGLLTVVENAVVDGGGGVDWEVGEVTTAAGYDEAAAAASSSPARRATARLGWLLLGFLAGAGVAAAVLLLVRHESPATCTVVPT